MYPPREQSWKERNRPSESTVYVVLGFLWLVLAGFGFLLSRQAAQSLIHIEAAMCFWSQALASKAGLKRMNCRIIGVSLIAVFLFADYFAGYLTD